MSVERSVHENRHPVSIRVFGYSDGSSSTALRLVSYYKGKVRYRAVKTPTSLLPGRTMVRLSVCDRLQYIVHFLNSQ